jgi:Flp pilus assembly pilin Flp
MFRQYLRRFRRDERGQDLVEYTLLIAFVALVVIGLMSQAGASLQGIWGGAGTTLAQAAGTSPVATTPTTPTTPTTTPTNPQNGGDGDHHDGGH